MLTPCPTTRMVARVAEAMPTSGLSTLLMTM